MKLKKGLVQVYTGNGKGKTTAALGLAMRATGAGINVYIGQFIKGRQYSEIKAFGKIRNIIIEQYGRGCFIKRNPTKKDIECAEKGLALAKKNILSKKYGLVVLDEINIALELGLLKINDVKSLLKDKPSNIEIVLTGRYAPKTLIKFADLVTEMKEIKHPYQKGVKARKGIES